MDAKSGGPLSVCDYRLTLAELRKRWEDGGARDDVMDLIKFQMGQDMAHRLKPEFDKQIARVLAVADSAQFIEGLMKIVLWLKGEMDQYLSALETAEEAQLALLLLKALLFFEISDDLYAVLLRFYNKSWDAFYSRFNKFRGSEVGHSEVCSGCEKVGYRCACSPIEENFHKLNALLNSLNLLDRWISEIIPKILHDRIVERVEEVPVDVGIIDGWGSQLVQWLDDVLLLWLEQTYKPSSIGTSPGPSQDSFPASPSPVSSADSSCGQLKHKMRALLYELYGKKLIDYMFVLMVEYPDSEPALRDLDKCLQVVPLRQYLVAKLSESFQRRLLQPGLSTTDIITVYIQTIKALRNLEPSGVIMDKVCHPIRTYLRKRPDTVRCIISYLMDKDSSVYGLNADLMQNQSLVLDDSHCSDEDYCDLEEDWEKWTPDPLDADLTSDSRGRKSADIISMLVGIYGSREMFVKEYSDLLAERLLKNSGADLEKEIRYLEMLKLRFGESDMHFCEVMIKDVQESKRVNEFVRSKEANSVNKIEELIPVSTLILSGHFWPQYRQDQLVIPGVVQESLEVFRKSFESLKANRTLEWRPSAGRVTLQLCLGEHEITCEVSPLLACAITKFVDKESYTADELAASLRCPVSVLRRRLNFWQSQGIITEHPPNSGHYSLTDESSLSTSKIMIGCEEDSRDESGISIETEEAEEQFELYWPYISGLLKNLKSLTAERIHTMLNMVCANNTHSLPRVQAFLDSKVKAQELVYAAGVYKLAKI